MKNKILFVIIIILLVLIVGIVFFANKNKDTKEIELKIDKEEAEKPKLNIINLDSNEKPYAIAIDNIKTALPQYGLQEAFIVYEIIVEGGQTRLLALFKDKEEIVVGPVRSARHYFLDYAMENDAIFVHHGQSPQGERDISIYKIQNLNAMTNGSSAFYREKTLKAPHNSFTNLTNLKLRAEKLKYNLETEEILLNYSLEEVDLIQNENSINAKNIEIYYSTRGKTKYVYDETNQVYLRHFNNDKHIDGSTKNQYTAKNIIVISVENMPDPDNSESGRQTIKNVGSGEGYYITNGNAIPISWHKESRNSKTIYNDANGQEIKINDGNTFIQIMPKAQELKIE